MSSASPSVLAALENVGPRLQALRTRRGLSLAQVAANTGISKSTLSRLETGQRRPSLELLLPLAQTYRVALDEMVGVLQRVVIRASGCGPVVSRVAPSCH